MEDLNKNTSELSKINREYPFSVPENYFDNFNARLQKKLQPGKISQKQNPVIRLLKPVIGLAASAAIIFMLIYLPLSTININNTAQDNFLEIENSMDYEYITILEEVDDNSLITFLGSDYEENSFSEEQLISYLSSNFSDYDIYIESE